MIVGEIGSINQASISDIKHGLCITRFHYSGPHFGHSLLEVEGFLLMHGLLLIHLILFLNFSEKEAG